MKYFLCFVLGLVLVGCDVDPSQCDPYVASLQGSKAILQYTLTMPILSLYPTIWAIIVVRKIFFA